MVLDRERLGNETTKAPHTVSGINLRMHIPNAFILLPIIILDNDMIYILWITDRININLDFDSSQSIQSVREHFRIEIKRFQEILVK